MAPTMTLRLQRFMAAAMVAPVLVACGDRRTFDTVGECVASNRFTQTQCQDAYNRASGTGITGDWASENDPVVLSDTQRIEAQRRRAEQARQAAEALIIIMGAIAEGAEEDSAQEREQTYRRPTPQQRERLPEQRPAEPRKAEQRQHVPERDTRIVVPAPVPTPARTPAPAPVPAPAPAPPPKTERYTPQRQAETQRYTPPAAQRQEQAKPQSSPSQSGGFGGAGARKPTTPAP